MISRETIDRIFEAVRIEEIIKDFVDLKKAGVNYKGRCPFHEEKTPSFVVSPSKGIYKCFGCGKGGNSVSFLQDLQAISYPEALRYIAEKYSIEVEEEELTDKQIQQKTNKDKLYDATLFAEKYFQDILWNTNEGKNIGLSYFKERGYNEEIIKKFKLGYSPKGANAFEKAAIKEGFNRKILLEASLIGENSNGKSYDKFKERSIFPIHSYTNKVIGFGGRSFNANAKSKYLNSAESLIYDKSKVLYGLNFAKQDISKQNNCYVVEGYTDVISMCQIGINNIVSASGTALSKNQILLIKRLTKNITLLFDNDKAGISATIRSIDLCLQLDMNVKVCLFPSGEDPDSFSKKNTSEKTLSYLKNKAINFVDYLISAYKLEEESDPAEIIEIKKKIISSISKISDSFSRQEYCKIYSQKLEVSEHVLLKEVNATRSQVSFYKKTVGKEKNISPTISSKTQKLHQQEQEILRILINYGNKSIGLDDNKEYVASIIARELQVDEIKFSKELHQNTYDEIIKIIKNTGVIDVQKLINNTNSNMSKFCIDLIAQAHDISNNWKERHNIMTGREDEKMRKTTEKAILSLKKEIVDTKISQIQSQIKQGSISEETVKILNDLIKVKTKIAKVLGRNIG
tara:strand:+ start:19719 stop:21605 length:1887 start_codon:yes stop_codon:yes gene_type:complete